jgi:diguanylate cyclase (GGDEF)-like protein/PAS domain S-box-containing protein
MDLTSIFDRGRKREEPEPADGPEQAAFDQLARRQLEQVARSTAPSSGDGEGPEGDAAFEAAGRAAAIDDPRTLAAVLESAPDAIVLFDAEGRIEDWSPAAERILGFARERVVGRNLIELVFPEHLREAMVGVLDTRGADWGEANHRSIDIELQHCSGKPVPVQLSLSWASGSGMFAAHMRDAKELGERELELASEARRRSRLLALGQLALGELELGNVIALASKMAREELGLNSFEVWRFEPDEGELVLLHGRGLSIQPGARMRPAAGSRVAEALAAGSAEVVSGDALFPSPWLAPEDFQENTPTTVAAIIAGPDGPLGVLGGTAGVGSRFPAAEIGLLESVALTLALALERRRFNDSLEDAEQRLRSLVERLPAITYSAGLGPTGRWHYVSPQVEEMLGISVQECLAGNDWWEKLTHPDDVGWVLAEENRVGREGKPLDISYRMRTTDGRNIWVRDRSSSPQRSSSGELITEGMITDITAQKEAEERLRHLADHDDLTDLLNRRGFVAAVDETLAGPRDGSRGALAIVDLDHFKRVNDSLGHAAGDALLKETAAAIALSLRARDIFGRLSGDEFGLFIPGIDESAAKGRLERLIELIRSGATGGPAVTASAGVIMIDSEPGLGADDLLIHADLALYRAKERGRDRVAFADSGDRERMQWVAEVREAIEEERLALYGQPIIELKTGEQYGSELLVRMLGRDGKPIPAKQFISTAERFGLIGRVDHWVVSRAIEVARGGARVSLNVSAASIADPQLTELVRQRLREARNFDPSLITFEITETVATPSIDVLREFAARVEEIGCGLALDDVGTGFGTLTYLQNLRFSQLKIDMEFVRGILDSATDRGIVRSLVLIAGQLGLTTVAEGVERPELLAELTELGVDRAQGFHLGRPSPIELPGR